MKRYRVVTDENGRYEVQVKEWFLLPWVPVCLGSFNTIETAIDYIKRLKSFDEKNQNQQALFMKSKNRPHYGACCYMDIS